MSLRFAYNTSGIANHRLHDALDLIADSGYQGVALTLDRHHLDCYAPNYAAELRRVADHLSRLSLGCVVATGVRPLRHPHPGQQPSLVSATADARARRVDFLSRALHLAAETQAEAMAFRAGVPAPGVDPVAVRARLIEGVDAVVTRAKELGTLAALELESGSLVPTIDDYRAIAAAVPGLRLALDTGHIFGTGDRDPGAVVAATAAELATVSIADMRAGDFEHVPLGEGHIDVAGVLGVLRTLGFRRLICVDVSRDSYRAAEAVPQAMRYLRTIARSG